MKKFWAYMDFVKYDFVLGKKLVFYNLFPLWLIEVNLASERIIL
jgi:hypothetical protein